MGKIPGNGNHMLNPKHLTKCGLLVIKAHLWAVMKCFPGGSLSSVVLVMEMRGYDGGGRAHKSQLPGEILKS